MKARIALALALIAAMLCGCDTYRYSFNTFVADDGTVTRTLDFQFEPYARPTHRAVEEDEPDPGDKAGEEAAAPNEDVKLGMPPPVVLPDGERFFEFELVEHGWHGAWQSDGLIHTDFRCTVPSYTVRGKAKQRIPRRLREPKSQREAFNEGLVTPTDLVLVKVFSYVERFHDYYTHDEFEEYANITIDRLGEFFLEVLHRDLGRQYDLRAFDAYVRSQLIPFAKKWKAALYRSLLTDLGIWDLGEERPSSDISTPEAVAMAHELMALGGLDAPYLDPENPFMACLDWLSISMHNLITRKSDKTLLSFEEIDAYFDPEPEEDQRSFAATSSRLVEKRYGDGEAFARRHLAIWDSFAQTGSDSHLFNLLMSTPGVPIHVSPKPDEITWLDNRTTVKWSFRNDHFFDGVQLSLITAAPAVDAQTQLFGAVVLDQRDTLAQYVVLFSRLSSRTRAAFLAGLRECVKMRDIDELHAAVHDRLPEHLDSHEDDLLDEVIDFLQALAEPAEDE